MKESVSFSLEDVESVSLNFSELREKGLEIIQDLSGDIWTDYNSHDPGVTILEQLCYALTDLGNRTSFPIKDLLSSHQGLSINAKNNAFFAPSNILSSHPVSINDIRKVIIDKFDEIENVWLSINENIGYEEQLSGLYHVDILPNLNCHKLFRVNDNEKNKFIEKVSKFLKQLRNIGEDFETPCLLTSQNVKIKFEIYLNDHLDLELIISNILVKLFEFVYCPMQFYTLNEMQEFGYEFEEIFNGPKLNRGFIKDDELREKPSKIHIDELKKMFIKVEGVNMCRVLQLETTIDGKKVECKEFNVDKETFFHILIDNTFESIYSNMKVFLNNIEVKSYNKNRIHNLFFETWSKKYRSYPIGNLETEFYTKKIKGDFRNTSDYFSIQNHFPTIYEIGKNAITSKNTVEENRIKAFQLKGYLLFFEQHLANHLSQLDNLHEFFNIDYAKGKRETYFTQKLTSVPEIDKLKKRQVNRPSLEDKYTFFNRKNRVYNHLLARFGEDLNEIPWKIAQNLNLINSDEEYNEILLEHKSNFLKNIESLSYNRNKGESFNQNYSRENSSGLEKIVLTKTGIPERMKGNSFPKIFINNISKKSMKIDFLSSDELFNKDYRALRIDEISNVKLEEKSLNIEESTIVKVDYKTLFKEALNYDNYKISKEIIKGKFQVVFQKEDNKWIKLFESDSEIDAIKEIHKIVTFFINQNNSSERIYIIDHIMLRGFIEEENVKYGFSFFNEIGEPFFQVSEDSFSNTITERNDKMKKFFKFSRNESSYVFENEKWYIKDAKNRELAVYKPISHDYTQREIYLITQSYLNLFDYKNIANGRLRFKEVEKIRLKGNLDIEGKHFGQRRLVFQRKLEDKSIVNEDFFNLNISIVLPDWPARFQDERFKSYLKDLIQERVPSHIQNQILWLDSTNMESFEEVYLNWENSQSKQNSREVYNELIRIKNIK
ncbi:hypothetical protein [Urechidicola croceus]|uniref:Uncharacterized protein n=1 Tax=Urechidicola croceus TaxID=1850246 RepID=A0A1D8P806_9FLAO|nr:hypothetical protein [Urechidicola croceus]AOW20703.1 hypothetical protein LPB138_08450 [Urechidicola croceus]